MASAPNTSPTAQAPITKRTFVASVQVDGISLGWGRSVQERGRAGCCGKGPRQPSQTRGDQGLVRALRSRYQRVTITAIAATTKPWATTRTTKPQSCSDAHPPAPTIGRATSCTSWAATDPNRPTSKMNPTVGHHLPRTRVKLLRNACTGPDLPGR